MHGPSSLFQLVKMIIKHLEHIAGEGSTADNNSGYVVLHRRASGLSLTTRHVGRQTPISSNYAGERFTFMNNTSLLESA